MELGPHTARLEQQFEAALARFAAADPFIGPARHFHLQAAQRRRSHPTVADALSDDALLSDIYATLTAWGMHRLGSRGPKLVEYDAFRDSLRNVAGPLSELERLSLTALTEADADRVGHALWAIIAVLAVSPHRSQLVAGTKAVHHLLPDLLPPVDRRYTLTFFFGRANFSGDGGRQFLTVFPQLARLARVSQATIAAAVGSGFHTGIAKTVDNAIVGYMLSDP